MNWVKKRKILATEAIQYNGWPYIELDDLWEALHKSFNFTQNHQVNISLLEEISNKEITKWVSFSKEKLINAIKKCNNSDSWTKQVVLETYQENCQEQRMYYETNWYH